MSEKKIPILKYLDILQREWVQFFWAYNSFPEKYRDKYKELAEDREFKIVDISKKIHVSSIFNDINVMEQIFNKIFNGIGEPLFTYRSENAKSKIHHFNLSHFFNGREVKHKDKDVYYKAKQVSSDLKTLVGCEHLKVADASYNFEFKTFLEWIMK
tara:strand:+ start:47325 stop:47792 length:468 start_codon:yes stop_codon:yes gene_type:complete